MKYMGSKNRYAKELLPIILEHHTPDMWYVEPFVGGANVIDKVTTPKRLGCDINDYLIAMWKKVSNGWMPPERLTEEEYIQIRDNKLAYPKELVGYVGIALSYGGKWFGGWRRDSLGKRDYVNEAFKNAVKQFPALVGVDFKEVSVFDLNLTGRGKCTIYCDPPYANTTKYKDSFDHERFYDWCVDRSNEGHRVFISEYQMPEDRFECVWSREGIASSLTKNTGSKQATERLFRVCNND